MRRVQANKKKKRSAHKDSDMAGREACKTFQNLLKSMATTTAHKGAQNTEQRDVKTKIKKRNQKQNHADHEKSKRNNKTNKTRQREAHQKSNQIKSKQNANKTKIETKEKKRKG